MNNNPGADLDKKMKMKIPLPSRQHKSSSSNFCFQSNSRITLSLDKAIEYELNHGRKLDPKMDRRKLRRTISNRLSAQRSRMKKAQYVDDMEKMANELEKLKSILSSQVECYKEKLKLLLQQNDSLQKQMEIRCNESKFCEIELQRKRLEICKLKQVDKTGKHDFRLKQVETKPHGSLGFYQNLLQNLNKNSGFGQSVAKDEKLSIKPEKEQEETETDQYLNFEAVHVDPASV